MKSTFFTIAALMLMSASVYGKGEATVTPGAPTGIPNKKIITPVKVTYDDAQAEQKANEEPFIIGVTKENTLVLAEHVLSERDHNIHYYKWMGDNAKMHNLNYGTNAVLPPLHGSIR